ncbi:MAG: hypothetical protein JWP57_3991 [Spirosoma sp.]|nr:hypothetical protein [Spirosoma sp.]
MFFWLDGLYLDGEWLSVRLVRFASEVDGTRTATSPWHGTPGQKPAQRLGQLELAPGRGPERRSTEYSTPY